MQAGSCFSGSLEVLRISVIKVVCSDDVEDSVNFDDCVSFWNKVVVRVSLLYFIVVGELDELSKGLVDSVVLNAEVTDVVVSDKEIVLFVNGIETDDMLAVVLLVLLETIFN